jgi:hypothetical protein
VKEDLPPSDFVFESELDLLLSVSDCLLPVTVGIPFCLFHANKIPHEKILAILDESKYKTKFYHKWLQTVLHGCGLPSMPMHEDVQFI